MEVRIIDYPTEKETIIKPIVEIEDTIQEETCTNCRMEYFQDMDKKGLVTKYAVVDDKTVGFIYAVPIENMPWGMKGEDLIAITCFYIKEGWRNKSIEEKLVGAIEEVSRTSDKKGVAIIAQITDEYYMPYYLFNRLGYKEIKKENNSVLMWKIFKEEIEKPEMLKTNYKYKPVEGKVVIDLFWNTYCQNSFIETQRIREVVKEFGNLVTLNEYCSDDPDVLQKFNITRGIYINGNKVDWGREAPKDGIRRAIIQNMGDLAL